MLTNSVKDSESWFYVCLFLVNCVEIFRTASYHSSACNLVALSTFTLCYNCHRRHHQATLWLFPLPTLKLCTCETLAVPAHMLQSLASPFYFLSMSFMLWIPLWRDSLIIYHLCSFCVDWDPRVDPHCCMCRAPFLPELGFSVCLLSTLLSTDTWVVFTFWLLKHSVLNTGHLQIPRTLLASEGRDWQTLSWKSPRE